MILPAVCGKLLLTPAGDAAAAAAADLGPAVTERAIVAKVEDPWLEEQQAYRARMGRWRSDVAKACDSNLFCEALL